MSTLRISNIEAKADNSSPTVDEQLKFTNSTGGVLLHLDGRTSGITTVGINTTAQTIKFDENNNVFITGIVTATELHGTVAVGTSVTYGDNEKAYFGTGLDLEIFHAAGANSTINNKSGSLLFQNNGASSAWINSSGVIYTNNDVIFQGASNNLVWDKSDNAFKFDDNAKIKVGTHGDLEIFHDTNHSYIKDTGTGYLRIQAADYLQLGTAATPAMFFNCESTTGSVYIAHNGNDKIQTTNTGAVVTGILTATTFSGAVTTTDACQVGDLTILNGNPDLKLQDSNHGGNNTEHIIAFKDSSGNNQMNIGSPFGEQHLRIKHGTTDLVKIQTNGLVGINTSSPTAQLSFLAKRSTQTYPPICFQSSAGAGLADAAISTTDDSGGTDIMMGSNVYMGQNGAFNRYMSGYGSAAVRCQYTGKTIFYNKSGNNAPEESMRIDGDGRIYMGTTDAGSGSADDLTIGNSNDHGGITIRTPNNKWGSIHFADGTSGDQQYRAQLSYDHGNDWLRIYAAAGERMRIKGNSEVNFLAGSDMEVLKVLGTDSAVAWTVGSTNTHEGYMRVYNNGSMCGMFAANMVSYIGNSLLGQFALGSSNNQGGASDGRFGIEFPANSIAGFKSRDTQSNGNAQHMVIVSGSSIVGYIKSSTSNASFHTSSDYRLKENVVDLTDGITRLKQLRPRKFEWKADSSNTLVDGFIAHEADGIVPNLVSGTKDAMLPLIYKDGDTIPDGKQVGEKTGAYSTTQIEPQTIDYAKLTPLLTAALQEAIAKIEVLEAKVAALESS